MNGATGRLRAFRDRWQPIVLACFVGVGGGWAAESMHVPLGWLLGSMFSTGVLAIAGVRLQIPKELRMLVMSIVGVYLGASFSPDVLGWVERSAITLLAMFAIVTLTTALSSLVMCKAMRCNAVTALTSCVPGGFSSMLLMARQYGGDEETVAMIHTVRMAMVIVAFSLGVQAETGITEAVAQQAMLPNDLEYAAGLVVVGLLVGLVVRLPILCLFVPMCLGGFLQIGAFTHLELPDEPLVFSLVVLGTLVGSQWKTLKGRKLVSCLIAGFLLGVFLISVFVVSAIGLARLLAFDPWSVVLAMSPGGVAEISLIAVSFNIEPSFVVLHQLLRVMFILFALPFVFSSLQRFADRKEFPELHDARER